MVDMDTDTKPIKAITSHTPHLRNRVVAVGNGSDVELRKIVREVSLSHSSIFFENDKRQPLVFFFVVVGVYVIIIYSYLFVSIRNCVTRNTVWINIVK